MARLAVLAVVAAGLVLTPGTAGAAGTNLTVVNSSTYDFGTDTNPVTACVDGTFVANLPVGGSAAVEITTQIGHTVGFIPGIDQDCTGGPTFSRVVDLEPDTTTTVALIRTSLTDGEQAVEWANDSRCYTPATGRITLRNGAFTTGSVYVLGTIDGVERRIFDDVGENAQATVELPAGTVVSNVLIVEQATDDLLSPPGHHGRRVGRRPALRRRRSLREHRNVRSSEPGSRVSATPTTTPPHRVRRPPRRRGGAGDRNHSDLHRLTRRPPPMTAARSGPTCTPTSGPQHATKRR